MFSFSIFILNLSFGHYNLSQIELFFGIWYKKTYVKSSTTHYVCFLAICVKIIGHKCQKIGLYFIVYLGGPNTEFTGIQNIARTQQSLGKKLSKKSRKNKRPQFSAPSWGPNVHLIPKSDSTSKITIETSLSCGFDVQNQKSRRIFQGGGAIFCANF